MDDRPFQDPTSKPTEPALQSALVDTYACYQKVLALANGYSKEWSFSKSSGWMLKVFDHKKALFYFIPFNDWFRISLTMRENEREAFLGDAELSGLHGQISSAKKFSEGFAMQLDVTGEEEYQVADGFLRKLSAMRVEKRPA